MVQHPPTHRLLALPVGVDGQPSGNGQHKQDDGYGDGDDGPLDRPGGDAGGSGKCEVKWGPEHMDLKTG